MKNTGQKLKAAREQQRVSVNEVAMATKISPRLIQAIEDGDVNALPAKTFLRGFVQSYASYLKLDVDDLLEVFHEEMGSTLPETKQTEERPSVEDRDRKKSPPLLKDKGIWPKVFGGGAILALIFIIIGVKNIVEKYEREADTAPAPTDISSLQTSEPIESVPTKIPAEQTKPIEAEVSKKEEPAIAPEPKVEAPPPVVEKPQSPPAPVEAATPPPEPKIVTPPVVAEEVKKPEPEVQPTPKPIEPKPDLSAKNEIIVEALDVVEIRFRVGNGDLKRIKLKPDQIHTIKAIGPVTLDLSDGGAVNLIHNGRDKGVPGDLGKPKKIKIQ